MTSMAVAAAQKVAASAFTPYTSIPSIGARVSLSADASVSSHVVTSNRQGQQSNLNFRGGVLASSHTPPPQNSTSRGARSGVPDVEFEQFLANALLQERMLQESQGTRMPFPTPSGSHAFFSDSDPYHLTQVPPVQSNSRYFAPFPNQQGAFRNDMPTYGENRRMLSEAEHYRRDQESFGSSSSGYSRDLSPSRYEHRSLYSGELERPSTPGRPDAFASLANRLNNLALHQSQSSSYPPRPFDLHRNAKQPYNFAIAGIVDSLERSLAHSPNQDWGYSPRSQEAPAHSRMRGFELHRDLDDILPNGRQVDPTRVMVSGISWQMSAHQIREELVHRCSKLGKVVDIEVAQYRGNSPSQLDRGRHRGFAFVTMETPEQAALVMTALHKMDMGGMQVQTKPGVVKDPMFARRNYAKKKAEDLTHKPSGRKHVKVFVGNLWFGTDSERLREAFQEFGMIVDTKVVRDKDSGESRGFGFVTFANEIAAVEAISARDGSLLDGRKLVVNVSRSWASSGGDEESNSEGAPSEFAHERH